MIVEKVERRIRGEAMEPFEALALEAFAFQFERVAPYRALCERSGRTPAAVASWRDVPTVPAAAFDSYSATFLRSLSSSRS